jgi:UDP-N-acetylmuramate--alanine ligase
VHSTAIPLDNPERAAARERGLPDLPRAELLAQLSALKRTIAVAGAHGKTTTTSMTAHVLLRCGLEPAYLIGGALTTTGLNADWGAGEWLVVEADESDRSMLSLHVDVAVVTNVELDHHATYGSTAELQEEIDTWLAGVPEVVRGWELEPVDFALAVPGEHNRRNAAAALEALVRVGVDHRGAVAALARFEGADRRFQLVGAGGGIAVVDDYGHNPTELRAALATARPRTTGRLVAVYVPHVVERTRHLYRELGEALGLADVAIVTDFVGRRDAPREGVSGRLVLDAVPEPTRRIWAPTLEDAAGLALRILRPGDMVVTLGVGEPWRAARAIVDGLPGPDES